MKHIYILGFVLFAVFFNATAQELSGYKLCIDPGHGGHDPANDRQINLPNGIVYWESEGNFETALHLDTILNELGAQVLLTRTGNEDADDIGLSARSTIANNFGADYFHSIHTNAANATANYTLVLFKGETSNPAFTQAKEMSDIMSPEIYNTLKTMTSYSRGDETFLGFNLGVLKNANMPSTLSEGAFHDVPDEGLRLKSTYYLKNYAWAIAKSFMILYNKNGFDYGRIGGIISDDFTNDALNGVRVDVTTNDSTCLVDDNYNGFYALDLMPGSYTLTISKNGYVSKNVNVTITANTYTDFDIELVYFNNGIPRADFFVTGLPAGAGAQVTFDASNSIDPDGTITSYEWDFGDGNTGTGEQINHTYATDDTYNVTLIVTDNEAKTNTIIKPVVILTNPPANPTILSVVNLNDNDIKITWKANSESDAAYRIYVSNSDALDDFSLLIDESTLIAGTTEYTMVSPDLNANGYNFKISAINNGGESGFSDTYSYIKPATTSDISILIVDGFDRNAILESSGSYPYVNHYFSSVYMQTIRDAENVNISSCANEAVADNNIQLSDYGIVVWFLGDESTTHITFSSIEQAKVKAFLESGGNLLVSGAEIGWDLFEKGTTNDKTFYMNYLKANFVGDGGSGRNPATGIGSDFEGVSLNFGQVYPEDWPDEISAATNAENILTYSNGQYGGIAYTGTFGTSENTGAIIHVSFPIESVSDKTSITLFMQKVLNYFATSPTTAVESFDYESNIKIFPVPVSNELTIEFSRNIQSATTISIYDFSGKLMYNTIFKNISKSNLYKINVNTLKSGSYILMAEGKEVKFTRKFIKK